MKLLTAILSMTLLAASGARAQDASDRASGWRLAEPGGETVSSPLETLFGDQPAGLDRLSPLAERPRLTVAVSPGLRLRRAAELPTFSWSLEAWEMNTASLAHIQCSRATRTIESFLVEDCRFVDRPLPEDSANLVQVRGRWMAAPGLSVSAGAFAGERPSLADHPAPLLGASEFAGLGNDRIEGVNMNVSFGLALGQVGDLLVDLQVERYRETPESFALNRGIVPTAFDEMTRERLRGSGYSNAGQLGVGWRGDRFSAGVTGQYQELPFWMSDRLDDRGFHSFDIEFSWRAPARSSISVGVSNVLDSVPGSAANAPEQSVEDAVDGIFGRIPYVRYKHDL
ncbi:MAG: hypothetical protein ACNS61_11520 [Candidatus Wenzhouxiangella sp. M2_3B_020]